MSYNFVAGPYTATWDPPGAGAVATIGTTKEGFTINITYHQRDIFVDEQGLGIADQVQAGMDVTVTLDFVEYTSIENALMAQQGLAAAQGSIISSVGKLNSALGGQLVLTPVNRTNNNIIYTFPIAIIVDDVGILLSSGLREGPCTWRCLPNNASSGQHYVKTLLT